MMPALGITVLKNNVPWGPFTRAQIDDGLTRGDFSPGSLAHAPGLEKWRPLGEVLDWVERASQPSLPPVPGPRELPPVPAAPVAMAQPAPPAPMPSFHRPPILPAPMPPAPERPAAPTPTLPPVVGMGEIKSAPKVQPAPDMREARVVTASFFARGIAFLIDCAILFVPLAVLFALAALAIAISGLWQHANHESTQQQWLLLRRDFIQLFLLVAVGFGWLYGAGLESSESQATIGKRWMGVKVTDTLGERISFLRATGRYASKYLSALPCFLGFVLALFSSKGRALHDRLADTRVVRK